MGSDEKLLQRDFQVGALCEKGQRSGYYIAAVFYHEEYTT